MGTRRQMKTLAPSQVHQLRANIANQAGNIASILARNCLGTLKDRNGKPYELSAGRIKCGLGLLQHVLPTQQSMQLENVTDQVQTRGEIEAALIAAMQNMNPADLLKALSVLGEDDKRSIANSLQDSIALPGEAGVDAGQSPPGKPN